MIYTILLSNYYMYLYTYFNIMKKVGFSILAIVILLITIYISGIYYITYSKGFRAGELIKFSNKGLLFKTWEGQISQGVSEAQVFKFSVEDREEEVIQKLIDYQGKDVKLTYKERFGTFPWLGDTKYFIIEVSKTE